jgi:hypothetical protein
MAGWNGIRNGGMRFEKVSIFFSSESSRLIGQRFGFEYGKPDHLWFRKNATPLRLQEFISAYEQESFDFEPRFILMDLIIYSFESLLQQSAQEQIQEAWKRIKHLLVQDWPLNATTIQIFAEQDIKDTMFHPFAQEIWETCSIEQE